MNIIKIKNKSNLIIAILIPFAVGAVSYMLGNNTELYESIYKPILSPPPIVFPIVWAILYLLMGISSYLIYESGSEETSSALTVYAVSLFFNFLWPIVFFKFQWFLLAFIWLIALILIIIYMIYRFSKINKTAGRLQIPYLIWCVFAAYLNYMIYILNR